MTAVASRRGEDAVPTSWAQDPDLPTPFLHLDLEVAQGRLRNLQLALPATSVHYVVAANSHPPLLRRLVEAGACFTVAGPEEIAKCLQVGAAPERLLYSTPIKRRADIAYAHDRGLSLFVVDSVDEVRKVAATAPGASVLSRLLTSGGTSQRPQSRKFGCPPEDCIRILVAAATLGLDAAGVSVQLGSPQFDPNTWGLPIAASAAIYAELHAHRVHPWLLDLGGGFAPAPDAGNPTVADYGNVIETFLDAHFTNDRPQTAIAAGRAVVADAGALVTTVLGVCRRGARRWVYLDAGASTGLTEHRHGHVHWSLHKRRCVTTSADGGPVGPAVLAGPSGDPADVLYECSSVELPLTLAEGDQVRFAGAGAYTDAVATTAL